jgi:uncharacterized protein YdaU (DUF1376 family)
MYYYQFHIGDYRAATAHLSDIEDLAYRRLLDMYYDTEMPIPLDTHWVSRRLRIEPQVLDVVLADFFTKTESGWTNDKCQKTIDAYHRQKTGGKKGADNRWAKRDKPHNDGLPIGSLSHTDSQPNQTPIATINHKPITNKKISPPEGVPTDVWQDYVKLRQAKKAPITDTAIKQIETQASKVGFTLTEAIQECLNRGWTGFKGDWVTPKKVNSYSPLD